jgi:subtilisin family serine protease
MCLVKSLGWAAGVVLVGLTACQSDSPTTPPAQAPAFAAVKKSRSYIVSLNSAAPADLQSRIERAGGRLKNISKDAGVATVESDGSDLSATLRTLPGVEAVGLDRVVQWVDPNQRFFEADNVGGDDSGAPVGLTERWYPIMWNLQAVEAPKAWIRGAKGKGARVAILDGGVYSNHVDIAPNLDKTASKSMVAGQAYDFDTGTFWHGTHVAGTVAAADNVNELGAIGIAPEATLIGVKVLHRGSGSFEQVINGIIYAATPLSKGGAGADIINMSLGATIPENDPELPDLVKAMNKATEYAYKQGVLVIASAGNGDDLGVGIDHDRVKIVTLPAQAKYVVGVSALAPEGYAYGNKNYDVLASYSNYGKSIVDLSGPGGDGRYPGNEACTMTVNPPGATAVTLPCYAFDFVLSSCRGGATATASVCWAAGTSMAAPAVAGVAALIVGQRGRMNPDALLNALARSADDLGARGFDAVYGRGRVNALRASGGGGGNNQNSIAAR